MISLIVCTRRSILDHSFQNNIEKTIGSEFEWIIIDNSKNEFNLFEAYNIGIKRSSGDVLCFIHDDIIFHTQNWGERLDSYFENNQEIGLIGIAGSLIKTKTPSAWWDCPENLKVINILQHKAGSSFHRKTGFNDIGLLEVEVIDGVFMAMRKNINVYLDEKIGDFHFYDFNLSLEVKSKGFKIAVSQEILLEHFSSGTINEDWCLSALKIHNKYATSLPLGVSNLDNMKIDKIENDNKLKFVDYLLIAGLRYKALNYCLKFLFDSRMNRMFLNKFRSIISS